MTISFQLAIFGITGLLIYLGIYYAVPRLTKTGIPLLYAFFGCLWLPVFLLLPLALYLHKLEGGTFTMESIVERFRFTPIPEESWGWIIAGVVVTVFSDNLFERVGKFFARIKAFAPPGYLPAPFNPLKKMELPPRKFFGMTLAGNWKLLLVFIPLHFFAMFCEEVMWRGYFLPLQEETFGWWAWAFNGILWAWLVHAVLKWHFIGMIPGMLITPLIAQMTQSTWAALIVHAVPNTILWLLLLWGILSNKGDKSALPVDSVRDDSEIDNTLPGMRLTVDTNPVGNIA
jgi:membrane protease YdiL (CAAX protease family)